MSLVAQLQNGPSASPLEPSGRLSSQEMGLLMGLLGELLNSGLLTATTGSISNSMQMRPVNQDANLLTCHLPPSPALYADARLRICMMPDALDLSARLGDYYDQLRLLRELITRWFSYPGTPLGGNRIELAAIAQAWRNLALLALSAIEELVPRISREAAKPFQERIELVTDLLARTAAGETPCLDPYGAVRIPAWADRRREARSRRGVQAFLQTEDSLQRVGVLDASEEGIGVLGLKGAEVGLRIGLLVKPGSVLGGTVVWVDGARAGIKLDAQLPAGSQLLSHLS